MGLTSGVKSALGYDSSDERDAAMDALRENESLWKGTNLPLLQKLMLENPQWLQDLEASTIDAGPDVQYKDAEVERAAGVSLDGTAMDGVSTDPRLKDQQLASLAALKDLADNGGMNATDEANLSRIQGQNAQADRGRRDAIMQGMQRRGMGGSGMELLAQLQSSQAATDRSSAEGMNIAGMAQDRALKALMEGGNLAGSVRGQDFGEQSQVAQARDAIAKFNAQNTIQTNQFNAGQANNMAQFNTGNQTTVDVANRNNAQDTKKFNAGQIQDSNQFNVTGRQGTHNAGVNTQNQATQYNTVDRPQQQFNNTVTKNQGIAGANSGMAAAHSANADREDAEFGQDVATVATIAAMASDKRAKKDIKSADACDFDHFLATIQPKKFKYKDEKHGEGDRTGVMAQDLQKSKLGSEAVVTIDAEGTLGYDKDKMQGIILGALKHLSDKIDKKGA
jgi:hypothetical protein